MIKRLSYIIPLLIFGFSFGQMSKEQLQKQNDEIKKQIAVINQNLAKTQKESRLSLAYLNNINAKIGLREKVYNNTQKEKKFIEDDIYLRQLEINKLNRELSVLRENYAQILIKAYKNKGVQNKVTFILSSKNLGEALRRVQYIKQYSDYQDKKAAEISDKFSQIKQSIGSKQKSVKAKDNLLNGQKRDLLVIETEKKQKEQLLTEFKQNEVKLTTELKQNQAKSKALESAIRNIINEEIKLAKAKEESLKKIEAEKLRVAKIAADKEKARIDKENRAKIAAAEEVRKKANEEAKKLTDLAKKRQEEERRAIENKNLEKIAIAEKARIDANEKAKIAEATAAKAREIAATENKKNTDAQKIAENKVFTNMGVNSINAGANFAANRGKMGFPVNNGNVTHKFGRQPHPVFKNIMEDNTGIKIAVSAGTKAKCVFPGTVTRIMVTGGSKTVLVKHGDYFTIYGNLASINVAANQTVSAGTIIGDVGTDFDGSYTLDFQIWNGSTPVDPLGWVSY